MVMSRANLMKARPQPCTDSSRVSAPTNATLSAMKRLLNLSDRQ